jgi:transcriptional regulator with GAF, ATPase, and Fis domain
MQEIPTRETLGALVAQANAVVPTAILGLARGGGPAAAAGGNGRVSVSYSWIHGIGEYLVPLDELPEALRPGSDVRDIESAALDANPNRVIEWVLRFVGVRRVLAMTVPRVEPATRLWMGFTSEAPLTDSQVRACEKLADAAADVIDAPLSRDEELERLRRLELAAGLLPALFRVLDVRDVFDRLSAIGKLALPHDSLTLGVFNDELTHVTLYAQTGDCADVARTFPQPYPVGVTRAWNADILDDRRTHPAEADRPITRAGMRSSVRVSVRLDDTLLGGVSFNSTEPNQYSSIDVAVARRLADHVAVALSHHSMAERFAEEARLHEALRTRTAKSDLVDEVLASVTGAGELPAIFDRVSNAAQKVLAHDSLVLTALLPGGKQAKVYASKAPEGYALPDVVEVPPLMLADPMWEYDLVEDLQADDRQRPLAAGRKGYRGALRVPIRFDNEYVAGLSFLSFTPSQYTMDDVPVARRIADRVALSFLRERGNVLSKQADEAEARAARLEARVRALSDELDARTGYRRVVGESVPWRQVLTQATQVAATETTVLLLGESGTGKEVIARFLHRASSRKNGPFVALNCAALPEQLLEAELFGYERGAYTGATQSKPGQLEQASGGTLFLDEVGEMSPSAQAKFLRVLQEREFQRLGGTRVLRTDTRIVAATNRDLRRAIALSQFREDLYYRLNVFAISLPPLRDRRGDIVPLSEAFIAELGRGLGRPPAGISRDARTLLMDYHWPGNVRELRNILERAAILCDGGLITADHLAITVAAPAPTPPTASASAPMTQHATATATAAASAAGSASAPASAPASGLAPPAMPGMTTPAGTAAMPASAGDLQSLEREMIDQALQRARFNKSKAAKALGLTRQQLYLRMRKYQLE